MTKGDIYYCAMPYMDCHIQKKERPVIILSHNDTSPTVTVIPITSAVKRLDLATHVLLRTRMKKRSMAVVEQITTVSKDYMSNFVCRAAKDDIRRIDTAVKRYLGVR